MPPAPNDLFYINEHPKIDAALKSFYSWFLAGQLARSADGGRDPLLSRQSVLLSFTRILSKSINGHIFPITTDRNTAVIAQSWNEIKTRQQKPTKWLGRTALAEAWPDLDFPAVQEETEQEAFDFFKQEFERLLLVNESSDAKLIWDADGGREELERRAQDRAGRAKDSTSSNVPSPNKATPFVEELDNE